MSLVTAEEGQSKAILAINTAVKALYVLYIANNIKCFSFKSGCIIRVAKHLKEDWFIVLR